MTISPEAQATTRELRRVRQARLYKPDPVPPDALQELLEVARWTGSSRNTQPWKFIVITDKDQLRQISQVRTPINWVADAPLAIAIVLDGANETSEAFDEGRITERLLIGARLLGLGGGTAWFGDESQQARAKEILGIPAGSYRPFGGRVGLPHARRRITGRIRLRRGRTSLTDLVSYDRFADTEC